MKKSFSFLFAFLLLCISVKTQAQVSAYTFNQSVGVYTEIAGDTTVAVATTTTTSGVNSMDDSVYPNNLIPFTFSFNGVPYNYFNISSNGFITFGATLPSATSYVPISATTAYAGALSTYGRDLIGNRGITATRTIADVNLTAVPAAHFVGLQVGQLIFGTGIPVGATITALDQANGIVTISLAPTLAGTSALLVATGSIVRGTTGAVGSRVHTIQFKRVRPWSTGANENMMNFQIKLYETSNKIEFVYGTNTNSAATTGQVGLRGSVNTDYNNRNTATAGWATTIAGTANTNTLAMSSTILPASGTIFEWTAPVINNDVGVTENVEPLKLVVGGPAVFPKAKIKNFGLNNQNVPFSTVYRITGPVNYQDSAFETLLSGQEKTLTFPSSFSPSTIGLYSVTIYTRLPGDQVAFNDTLKTSFSVNPEPNFGNEGGYFFANNLATNQISYPRWGWKDTSGSKNLILNGVQQPGTIRVGTSNDDAYFVMNVKQMLLEFNQDTTDKVLKFNGVCYDSIFPGTNGIIGLTQQFGVTSINSFNVDGALVADNALLPFWKDFNLGALGNGTNRLSYKVKFNQLIITYDRAVAFAPTTDWVSFQVVIEIAKGCVQNNSNWRVTVSDTLNQKTSSSFYANYLAQYNTTPPAVTVFRNYVVGWSGLAAPIAYNGYVSSTNPFPATPPTNLSVKRPMFDFSNGKGLAIEFGANQSELNMHDVVYLDLSLSLEGLQSNGRVRDTVEVIIRDGNAPPYKIMQRSKVFLDSAHNGSFAYGRKVIEATVIKDQYPLLLEIRHRNSITSWSNIFIANSVAIAYNFTTGLPQIYGGNGILINGAASYYAGDVNGDEVVDLTDVALIDNDAFNFAAGDYLITDLNWDGVVDLVDAAIADNNAFNFVTEVKYPGAVRPYTEEPLNYSYKAPTETIVLPDAYAMPKIDLNAVQNIDIKKED